MLGQSTLKAWDAINGAEGKCMAEIDGKVEEMIYVTKVDADIEKNKVKVPVLGCTGKKSKAAGWEGKGTLTMYGVTSMFGKQMEQYAKTGRDIYFNMLIENRDPSSGVGGQKVLLKQVNLDSVKLAMLSVESALLEIDSNFTFHDFDIIESFTAPVGEII